MNLSQSSIDKFIAAWAADFGESISRAEAQIQAQRLYALYTALADIVKAHPEKFPELYDTSL